MCDTDVVGATPEPLGRYLAARLLWVVVPALVAGVGTWIATRWLVGRSLRPVDAMRRELATITSGDVDRRIPVPDTGDELEASGKTLDETIARLAAALEANERFVADAAHELRTPITGVRAALELQPTESALIDGAIRELDRASELIDDLLVLARHQAGISHREELDFDDLVLEECGIARARFDDVVVLCDVEPIRMAGDANALRRMVRNLVENACRQGGGRVEVTVWVEGDHVQLRVDDDGPGIPVRHRAAVFGRFTRLDVSRSRATGGPRSGHRRPDGACPRRSGRRGRCRPGWATIRHPSPAVSMWVVRSGMAAASSTAYDCWGVFCGVDVGGVSGL